MSTLERQLRRYVLLRLVVIVTIALVYVSTSPSEAELATPGFYLRLLVLGVTSLLYFALRRPLRSAPEIQAWVQFIGDLLLITAMVHYSGGPISPFSPLYLIVISTASTILRKRAGMVAAAIAFALYAGLLLFVFDDASPTLMAYSLLAHFVGFFAVDRLTSFLAQTAERTGAVLANLEVVHRDVVESIPSGIFTTDLAGVITSVNRTGTMILGREAEALVGSSVQESGLLTPGLWDHVTEDSSSGLRLRSEVRLERDGGRIDVGFSVSRLADSEGAHRGYIIIFQDLTPWRRLEEEVRIKDRMAAVGEMAAGLAHEIGNPLAAISGSVQMLSRSAGGSSEEEKLLAILLKESQRLDRTIKGFLRFARPKERSTSRFDVAALIAENVELLRNSPEVGPGHAIEVVLDPPAAAIVGDPDQISQIFWNLARNALKAMPEAGRLTISGALAGDTYALSFTDTGRGMSEAERANLFHPFQSFFDTGTGIGMAIVYRIVEDHGGNLRVESTPGRGSSITVELPVAAAARVEVTA